jgi:hypothetical protein
MTTDNKHRRIMGELICLDGDAEAEAIGAKLHAAGFGFKVTDDVDECSDNTRFMMVWLDIPSSEPEENDRARFEDTYKSLVGFYDVPDNVGYVAPDHMPAKFGDFGEWPSGPPGVAASF